MSKPMAQVLTFSVISAVVLLGWHELAAALLGGCVYIAVDSFYGGR